ncbi:MAG: CAP domain-containing protein [Actinomycetota bacterium]
MTDAGGAGHSDAAVRLATAPVSTESVSSVEAEFMRLLNESRTSSGKASLAINADLAHTSRTWSTSMQGAGSISHDPNLSAAVTQAVPNWTRAAENVGVGYDAAGLHQAFWNSAGHRANMLGDFNQVGVGATYGSDGRLWVTFRFAKGSAPVAFSAAQMTPRPDRIGVHRSNGLYLRKYLSSGPAQLTFTYGTASDKAVMGDWNADGLATPGVFRDGLWHLRNSNSGGEADITLSYGQAGDTPVVGDWDGNGTDTIGVRRGETFLLRNSNTSGAAQLQFAYGRPGDIPVIGDWDGNGTDTIGVRRGGSFLLRNSNSGGNANLAFTYGWPSDTPLTGDWDGNGKTTIGVRRGNILYLRNYNSSGSANRSFSYGTASDVAVVGGW